MDFTVNERRARGMAQLIVQSRVVLQHWTELMHYYLVDPAQCLTVKARLKEQNFEEAISLTLEYWVSRNGDRATFRECVDILRNRDFNAVAATLEENARNIRNIGETEWPDASFLLPSLETFLAFVLTVVLSLVLVALFYLSSDSGLADEDSAGGSELEITGSPGRLVNWNEIVEQMFVHPRMKPRHLNISYADFGDPNRFLIALQTPKFSELRTIHLSHIIWNPALQFTEKVHTPYLEEFTFTFSHDMELELEIERYFAQSPRDIKCTTEAQFFLSSLIFVYKEANVRQTGAELIDSLNMNVTISVGSEELHFAWNPLHGSVSLKGLQFPTSLLAGSSDSSPNSHAHGIHEIRSLKMVDCLNPGRSPSNSDPHSSWLPSFGLDTTKLNWTLSQFYSYLNQLSPVILLFLIHVIVRRVLSKSVKNWAKMYPALEGSWDQIGTIESLMPIVMESLSKVY